MVSPAWAFTVWNPYNFSPRAHPPKMNYTRFIVHFKGDTKHFAPEYARLMLRINLDRR